MRVELELDNNDNDHDGTDLDQVGDELGQVGDHAGHAAFGDGAQSEDPRLLDLPLRMEQSFLERRVFTTNID